MTWGQLLAVFIVSSTLVVVGCITMTETASTIFAFVRDYG